MPTADPPELAARAARSGAAERQLATGAAAQQISQVLGTVVMLGVITVVARSKTLSEFGLYGLLISFTTYVLIAQTSVEGAAVKALSEARNEEERDRAFTVALTLYSGAGVTAGVLLAAGGLAILGILNIPVRLHHEAILGVVSVAGLSAVGWPLKAFQDVLRGGRKYVLSASAEGGGYLLFGAASAILLVDGAPLWTLIAAGAALPLFTGVVSLAIFTLRRSEHRFRRALLTSSSVKGFLGLSGYLFLMGIADLVIYSLDRAVLSGFRSPTTVGLYEGPLRVHNLIRQINGTLSLIVLPSAAAYLAQGDQARVRELLLRGTRYVVAAVVPVTVSLMMLAAPILRIWLGNRYEVASGALVILISYWLVASGSSVASSMLIAAGRARSLTFYAGAMAIVNLALSLSLTPSLGLDGVVLGTAIPYVLLSPMVIVIACRVFPIDFLDLVRRVWLPAFSLAIPLAAGLAVVRIAVPIHGVLLLLLVLGGGLALYWAAFYLFWMDVGERLLIRDLIGLRGRLSV